MTTKDRSGVDARRVLSVALAVLALLLTAGCANIPTETRPKVLLDPDAPDAPVTEAAPDPRLNPYDIVQEFLNRAGNVNAARTYLVPDKQDWAVDKQPVIAQGEFRLENKPVENDGSKVSVRVSAQQYGYLKSDGSFFPQDTLITRDVVVQRQPDGGWRISNPPSDLLMTKSTFDRHYRQIDLMFFDPDANTLVRDPRYVLDNETGIYSAVLDLLRAGPSEQLAPAVRSAVTGLKLKNNISRDDQGRIVVNIKEFSGETDERIRLAAQVVTTLWPINSMSVRLLLQDRALMPEKEVWRASDFEVYTKGINAQNAALAVSGGRVVSLDTGKAVDGTGGTVVSAAQSLAGGYLAVVEGAAEGQRLRIGRMGSDLRPVELPGPVTSITRPTWRVGADKDQPGNEVWAVVNGNRVYRAVRTPDDSWQAIPVTTDGLVVADDTVISDLRLSRDGVRVAAVVNGTLQVAPVIRGKGGEVSLNFPRTIQEHSLINVTAIDWVTQTTLMVACASPTIPLATVGIDGQKLDKEPTTPLILPIRRLAAAASYPTIVTDSNGTWQIKSGTTTWTPHPRNPGPATVPFYPG